MASAQILVVEDEHIVARSIERELDAFGYNVTAIASSGEEALEKVAETQPDLVLMDISLQGDMDGIQTTERMHEQFDIPVVYLTAYSDERTLERAQKTKPFGYLLKPYEERELLTTIETALQRHRTESMSAQVRPWLTSALHSVSEGVIITDARARVIIVNPAAERISGWSQQQAEGMNLLDVFELVNAETHAPVPSPAIKALHEGKAVRLEPDSLLVGRLGRETPVDGTVAPITSDPGKFSGFVTVFREVLGSSHVERTFPKNGRPHRWGRMDVVNWFSAGMAHDFNQFLTVISGNVSLALSKLAENDPIRNFLTNAEKASEDAAELVKQALTFAKTNAVQRELVDMNLIVPEITEVLGSFTNSRIAIDITLGRYLWKVLANPVQMKEVLINLCLNARDAMPDGGELCVQTENVVRVEDYCRTHPRARPGEFVCVGVSDTGRGIAADIRSHIFEPFFTTKSPDNGSGLGLALVRQIVTEHGGWIDFESIEGKALASMCICHVVKTATPSRLRVDEVSIPRFVSEPLAFW